jgi:dynein assembly factor with WDR repeat domains 1
MTLMLLCRMLLLQLWDVETGKERATLSGHTAEIVSVCFNTAGDLLATGSFDHDSRLWDLRSGQCVHVLSGHRGEVSSTVFNHAGAEAHKSAVRVAAAVA